MAEGAALVAAIRAGHPQFMMLSQRAGHEWHEYLACKTCRVAWPCEAIAAAAVIEALLARFDEVIERHTIQNSRQGPPGIFGYEWWMECGCGRSFIGKAREGNGAALRAAQHQWREHIRHDVIPVREPREVGHGPHD